MRCWTWRASRQPGSDHQLAFVNALCASVLSPNHIAVLSTLLDNEPAAVNMPGLVIDTDLRWRIVTALAAAGVIDADGPETPFIDAEAERDPTAAGGRHAAQAAAARPQLAVKEADWQEVIEDDTLANVTARSIIVGFVRPGQDELLKPFRDKYFGAISGVWQRRSSEVAQTVVIGLYPSWDVSQAGLDAADAFLADAGRAAAAASAGARGPRRGGARPARKGIRRHLTFSAWPTRERSVGLRRRHAALLQEFAHARAACCRGGRQSKSQGAGCPQAQAPDGSRSTTTSPPSSGRH